MQGAVRRRVLPPPQTPPRKPGLAAPAIIAGEAAAAGVATVATVAEENEEVVAEVEEMEEAEVAGAAVVASLQPTGSTQQGLGYKRSPAAGGETVGAAGGSERCQTCLDCGQVLRRHCIAMSLECTGAHGVYRSASSDERLESQMLEC